MKKININEFKSLNEINALKPYLKNNKDLKIQNAKKFDKVIYDNLKIQGTLFREVNWEMYFELSFYIFINKTAKNFFSNDEINLYWWLQRKQLGKFFISNEIKNKINLIPWWDFDPDVVVSYNYERNLKTLKYCKLQFFSIDIILYPPDTYKIANDVNGLKEIYFNACEWISKLNCFQNNEFIEFRSCNKKENITS